MSIFDAFPHDRKIKQVAEWLVPGAIVYLTCSWVNKNYKDKYLVVATTEPECLLLMINTEARRVTIQTQVQLFAADYPGALTGDCFIDCHTVVSEFTLESVSNEIINDGRRYRGKLTQVHQAEVVAAIKFAKDISPKDKRLLLNALDAV